MSFDLQLVEEKVKRHQVTAMHLTCALAFIAAGAIIVIYNYTIPYWGLALLVAGIILMLLTIVKNKWVVGKNNPRFRVAEVIIAAAMAIYSYTQHWTFPIGIFSVLTLAAAFALFWERATDTVQFIHIDNDGIRLPITSRKRFITWVEIDAVLLRYGTLTVECIGNHLYQWNVQNVTFDKEALEQFSRDRVEEHKSKRIVDEW